MENKSKSEIKSFRERHRASDKEPAACLSSLQFSRAAEHSLNAPGDWEAAWCPHSCRTASVSLGKV